MSCEIGKCTKDPAVNFRAQSREKGEESERKKRGINNFPLSFPFISTFVFPFGHLKCYAFLC